MRISNKARFVGAILCLALSISGCSGGIYKDTNAQTAYSIASVNTLMEGVVYVKDGTKFHPIHADGVYNGYKAEADPNPVEHYFLITEQEQKALPILYKGESICTVSSDVDKISEAIQVERFKSIGWTVGLAKLSYSAADTGQYTATKSDLRSGTDMENVITSYITTDKFAISTVNGKKPTITLSGTIRGLKKNQEADLDIYVGSENIVKPVKADCQLLQSSESFTVSPEPFEGRGYASYKMPDDAETGFYFFGSAGMFLYVNTPRAESGKTADFNVPNAFSGVVHSIDDLVETETSKTQFRVRENTKSVKIAISSGGNEVSIDAAYAENEDGKKIETNMRNNSADEVTFDDPEAGYYQLVLKGRNVRYVTITIKDTLDDSAIEAEAKVRRGEVDEAEVTSDSTSDLPADEPEAEGTQEQTEEQTTQAPTPEPTQAPTPEPTQAPASTPAPVQIGQSTIGQTKAG